MQISNYFFMIPRPQKGCIVCLRTEKRLPRPYFFSHVITFFEKQKPFVHVLVLGFFCKFSFCFLDEILILASHSTGCERTPGLHIKTESSRFIHLENTIHSQGINTNGRLRIPPTCQWIFLLPSRLESVAFPHLGADVIGARWRGLSTLVWFWVFLCLNS